MFVSDKVAEDCLYFKGDIPCKPNKEKGAKCKCEFYKKRGKRILIIKLAAMGDVLRTTPISTKLREVYPNCEITWVTNYPEIAEKAADVVMPFNERTIVTLMADEFDILYNFDKDKEACSLAKLVKAGEKKGFTLHNGKAAPIDQAAEHKFITGVFDEDSKKNKKSYQQEIFEMVGLEFSGEGYLFDSTEREWDIPEGKIIGLNTGGADRWVARLWPEKHWIELAKKLKDGGYVPLLLGGEAEDERNKKIAEETGATYLGFFPLKEFASLVKKCDAVVTGVTLGFHIAAAMERNIILLNNIFNKHEFELYNRGNVIEPDKDCECFYKSKCIYGESCMNDLPPEKVFSAIKELKL
jgi:ADP-heptose:LPS heptosyltransferase